MPDSPTPADVVVIGGGPGGYVAAIRAAQLGLSVVCVEMDRTLGGTCVNVGCIPSKALLESSHHFEFMGHDASKHGIGLADLRIDVEAMLKRKDDVVGQNTKGIEFLFRKNKITWAKGRGTLRAGNVVEVAGGPPDNNVTSYQAKHVIIATGSVPIELPFLKFDEERILSNVGALTIPKVPQHLIVVGGGIIGLELGSVWRRLGAEVVVLEALDTFLPMADGAVAKEALKHFKKLGLDVRLGAKVSGADKSANGVTLKYTDASGEGSVTVDKVVVAIGRRPFTKDLLADGTGVQLDERGFVKVDHDCKTGVANVWAIGDLVRGPMLAHKGKEEGVMVADLIAGKVAEVNYKTIPSVIYTAPEIAWVGQTEEEVKKSGRAYKVGQFPFLASGRARAMESTSGFCKVISATDDDEILGVHIIGPLAGELIAEAVLALEYSASTEDIQRTIHAHPTLSEALHEAALNADKIAIDFPNR